MFEYIYLSVETLNILLIAHLTVSQGQTSQSTNGSAWDIFTIILLHQYYTLEIANN